MVVSNKQSQIDELEVIYSEKLRQAEVEFDLTVKANAEKVLNEWLKQNGKVSVYQTDLDKMTKELAETKANLDNEIKLAVTQTTNTLKAQYENEIKLIQAEHRAISAENSAKIEALEKQNIFLDGQVNKMVQQLEAERAAGIERSKASSIGSINLASETRGK